MGSWPGNETINLALMRVPRRSESVDQATLAATFVDLGPLFPTLRSTDHQILFGRRGTGKTHARPTSRASATTASRSTTAATSTCFSPATRGW